MMLCEVDAYYKQQGKTLWDAMVDMYEEYGYYKEGLATMTLKGIDGAKEIQTMMTNLLLSVPSAAPFSSVLSETVLSDTLLSEVLLSTVELCFFQKRSCR